MIPGAMDKFITLEKETTSKNEVGTPVETYVFWRKTFATIKYTKGNTEFDEAALPFTNVEFLIRWNNDVNLYKCRIFFEEQYYKILHVENIGRRDGIRLKCILWDE